MTRASHPPAAQHEPANHEDTSPTTRATATAVVVGAALVLLTRIPATVHQLKEEMPTAIRAGIDDPGLERLALYSGVFLGMLVTLFSFLVFVLVARFLERNLFTESIGRGRWKAGLFVTVHAGTFVVFQVLSVVPVTADLAALTKSLLATAIAVAAALIAFQSSLAWARHFPMLAGAALFGLATTMTAVPQ